MEGDQSSPVSPRLKDSPFLVYGVGIVSVLAGVILIATFGSMFAVLVLGFVLVALGGLVVLTAFWLMVGRIADPRLRKASRVLFLLFVGSYFLAVVSSSSGEIAKIFFTDVSAGSMTGLIVLLAAEYVRRGNL